MISGSVPSFTFSANPEVQQHTSHISSKRRCGGAAPSAHILNLEPISTGVAHPKPRSPLVRAGSSGDAGERIHYLLLKDGVH